MTFAIMFILQHLTRAMETEVDNINSVIVSSATTHTSTPSQVMPKKPSCKVNAHKCSESLAGSSSPSLSTITNVASGEVGKTLTVDRENEVDKINPNILDTPKKHCRFSFHPLVKRGLVVI